MIYASARWADAAQTMVVGTDSEGRTETVPAGYTLFRQPDDGPVGFVANGGVIEPYVAPPATIPDMVSARQFKLQLLADGLLDDVEMWIAAQDRAVQIAFEYSGTFVRAEPMMQAGFAALGFTEEQGDAFFAAAALL